MESEPAAPRKLNAAVPPDLETVCLKCLEKNPARRYPSARALAEELGRFLNHEPIQALPVTAARKAESWLRRHPWTLMAAASSIAMVLMGLLYWQFERVKFLEHRPLLTDQALRDPGLRMQQLKGPEMWRFVADLVGVTIICTLVVFLKYGRGKASWRLVLLFEGPTDWAPTRPAGLRLACGLIGVAVLGFTVLYLARFIRVSVWEGTPRWSLWFQVCNCFYFSLTVLFYVVRDYQKFVHGMPGRTLPAELIGSLRQAILERDLAGAVKLYRRTMPEASLAEAQDYVQRLAGELIAKHPEK